MLFLMKSPLGFFDTECLDKVLYLVNKYEYELIGYAETESDLIKLWNQMDH